MISAPYRHTRSESYTRVFLHGQNVAIQEALGPEPGIAKLETRSGELSTVIVLIPHIVADREMNTLGGLCNAENRLSLLQGKRDFRHPRLLWRLSPEALPENHHRQDIQGSQGNNQ